MRDRPPLVNNCQEKAIQQLLKNQGMNLERCIADLIETQSFPIHFKDARTGKYILSNAANLLLGNKRPEEIVGLVAEDLLDIFYAKPNFHSPTFNGRKQHDLESMHRLESEAKHMQRPVREKRVYFSKEGFVCLEEALKVPILNTAQQKTVLILTCSKDLTASISLPELFQLYRNFYPHKQAIELLLKYLKIRHFFLELPTSREMQTLLTLNEHPNRKEAAHCLSISYNTLASHLQHISNYKLVKPDLNTLLRQMSRAALSMPNNPKIDSGLEIDTPSYAIFEG